MQALVLTVAIVLVLVVALVAVWRIRPAGVDGARLGHLLEPRITTRPPTSVLQVVARGDPGVVARDAFGLVMRTYFRLPGVPRVGPACPAPRARWSVVGAAPREDWVGAYAMPVPDSLTALPHGADAGGLHAELARWEYGEVAEVLHVGSYDTETPTIERLRQFIARSHYVVAGDHEEEYVKGPGIMGRGNPRHYLTLIRYQVRPEAVPADTAPRAPAVTVTP
jgi:hypothetical protein